MNKLSFFLWFAILLLSSCSITAADKIDLRYRGVVFSIPANNQAIGSLGGENNVLIIRYGEKVGSNYLAFDDLSQDRTIDYGCDVSKFYREAFTSLGNEVCNSEQLFAFRSVFLSESPGKVWVGENATAYYAESSGKRFVFLLPAEGGLIKIDTDFLSVAELREVVSNYF